MPDRYLSADFRNHPVSHLFQSVPALHDRAKFKVSLLALNDAAMTIWAIIIWAITI